MKSKTQVINIFGGPSVGKSTIAAGLYSVFKQNKISCELVTEFAKEITWEETQKLLENQIHIFAEQFRRQWRLVDKVDYIITDSPILLNSIYYDYYLDRLGEENLKFSIDYIQQSREFFDSTFLQFNNNNYFVTRSTIYEENGRNQSLDEAINIDKRIIEKLTLHKQPYLLFHGDTTQIIEDIGHAFIRNKKK